MTALNAFAVHLKAEYRAEPIIGLDSLNRLMIRQLKFPNAFIKYARPADITFSIDVDSSGHADFIYVSEENDDSSMQRLYRQFEAILSKLEWNRNIPSGFVYFKITFPYEKPVNDLTPPAAAIRIEAPDPEPMLFVEVEAEFPSGNDNFTKYINDWMKFPARCLEEGIEGTVHMQFAIE